MLTKLELEELLSLIFDRYESFAELFRLTFYGNYLNEIMKPFQESDTWHSIYFYNLVGNLRIFLASGKYSSSSPTLVDDDRIVAAFHLTRPLRPNEPIEDYLRENVFQIKIDYLP